MLSHQVLRPQVCSDQDSGALVSCLLDLKPQPRLGWGTQTSPAPRERTPLGASAQTLDRHGGRVSRQTLEQQRGRILFR